MRDQRVDEKFQTYLQPALTKALSKLQWFHSFQRKDYTNLYCAKYSFILCIVFAVTG